MHIQVVAERNFTRIDALPVSRVARRAGPARSCATNTVAPFADCEGYTVAMSGRGAFKARGKTRGPELRRASERIAAHMQSKLDIARRVSDSGGPPLDLP